MVIKIPNRMLCVSELKQKVRWCLRQFLGEGKNSIQYMLAVLKHIFFLSTQKN